MAVARLYDNEVTEKKTGRITGELPLRIALRNIQGVDDSKLFTS